MILFLDMITFLHDLHLMESISSSSPLSWFCSIYSVIVNLSPQQGHLLDFHIMLFISICSIYTLKNEVKEGDKVMLMPFYFSPFCNPLHSCQIVFQYFSNPILRIFLSTIRNIRNLMIPINRPLCLYRHRILNY